MSELHECLHAASLFVNSFETERAPYHAFRPSTISILSCTSSAVNLCMSLTAFPAIAGSSSPCSALLI
jgi:hypothetical protein